VIKTNRVWDLRAPHGPATGALNVALGCVLCAEVGQVADLGAQPWAAVSIGAIGVAVSAVAGGAAALTGVRPRAALMRAAVWSAATGWGLWAALTTPWAWPQMVALGGGALVAGVVAAERRHDRAAAGADQTEGAPTGLLAFPRSGRDRVALDWEARILRVCKVAVRVVGAEQWPTKTGYTLDIELPAGGVTGDEIGRRADALASDARLPAGCGVEMFPGAHRGAILLKVSTEDALSNVTAYDATPQPARSVYDPIRVGRLRDGSPAEIVARYDGIALVGQINSGKTNILNVITGHLAECSDVLLWGIDRTGGMFVPWQAPHEEGRASRPTFDRVAADPAEIDQMLTAAQAIIDGRKAAYKERMRAMNADVVHVGADVPQLVITVDELGRLVRDRECRRYDFATRIAAIGDTGRATGVRIACCALRATADYLPPEIKAQSAIRIGMRVSSESELAYLHGWDQRLSPADAPHQGSGHLIVGHETPTAQVFRADFIDRATVDQVAVLTADRRPDLDAVSRQLADDATRGWYSGTRTATPPPAAAPRPSVDDVIAEANRDRAARRAALDAEISKRDDEKEWLERFNAITASINSGFVPPDIPDAWSAGQRRLVELVRERRAHGITVAAAAEQLGREGHVSATSGRQTVNDWMRLAVAAGLVVQPRERGPYYAKGYDGPTA
jgi:hypothetical protein